MIGCITGAQKCSNNILSLCVCIEIAFIASRIIYFSMVRVGGNTSDGVEFFGVCIVSLTVVINTFDCLCGGVECILAHSPSEVGMVTPSECCVSVCYKGGFGSVGIMPGVFTQVTCWCVHGSICI